MQGWHELKLKQMGSNGVDLYYAKDRRKSLDKQVLFYMVTKEDGPRCVLIGKIEVAVE